MTPTRRYPPAEQRLRRRLRPEGDCLIYNGLPADGERYGRLVVNGRGVKAHRLAYELAHGPIPPGLVVMHTCDHPPCCRIEHLRLGTVAENNADRHAKGRTVLTPNPGLNSLAKTHCPRGHAYDETNTLRSQGRRHCRTCRNAEQRRYRAAKKAVA